MNRNTKIVAVVVVLALIGGGIYFATSSKDDNQDSSNSQTQSSDTSNQSSEQQTSASFSPLSTKGQPFVATITTTGGEKAGTMVLSSDGKDNSRMVLTSDGKNIEFYYTKDAYYMCQNSQCFKYPSSQSGTSAYNPSDYDYDDADISRLKNNATYKGVQSCPAGSCDVWSVTEGGTTSTVYIDTKTKKISQVEGTVNGVTTKIVYEYKAVTITPPANAQTIPSL